MDAQTYDGGIISKGLSQEEIRELSIRVKQGDPAARELLILGNLRLVQTIAKKNAGRGVPVEDLYQEGCYGLIRAIDQYEYRENSTFQAFARHYINKYIQQAMYQQGDNAQIKLSEEYFYMLRKYQHKYAALTESLGRAPNTSELAEAMGLNASFIRKLNCVLFRYVSLEDTGNPESENAGRSCSEIISSTPDTQRPTEQAALSLLNNQEEIFRQTLTDVERAVITRRVGMTESKEVETFPSISADLGISIETARRAFARGIKKLRKVLDIDCPQAQKKADSS